MHRRHPKTILAATVLAAASVVAAAAPRDAGSSAAAAAPQPTADAVAQVGQWFHLNRFTDQTLRAVKFVDPTHGWAVGGQGEEDCVIGRTLDGVNWAPARCPVRHRLGGVDFVSDRVGWAVGDAGTILRTDDGGVSWGAQDSERSDGITGIDAWDANLAYAVTRGGAVLKTTNGGQDWRFTGLEAELGLFDVDFVDPGNGWVVGSGGLVYRTVDGFRTWTGLPFGLDTRLVFVDFADGARGWMGGNRFFATNDGGWNWSEIDNFGFKGLEGFHAIDRREAWAVGDEGIVVHTTDGEHWGNESTHPKALKDVYFVDRDHGWIVGDDGYLGMYVRAVPTVPPSPVPTNTPTPTLTPTPTKTPTLAPSPTPTPPTPWIAVGNPRVTFRLAPGARTPIVVLYGNLTPGGMIDFTLVGPAVFVDSGSARLSAAVNQPRGRLDVVIQADAAAEPGTALTIEARSGSALSVHRGVIAYSVRLPRVSNGTP